MAHKEVSSRGPHPVTSLPSQYDFDSKIALLWTPPAPYRCPERAKMAPYLHPTCVRSVWVRSALDRCINVVLTTKKVTKEVKK